MAVRKATPDDATALATVHLLSWRAAYRGLAPQHYLDALDPARRASRWRESLIAAHPAEAVLVWEDDGALAGFVSVSPARDPDLDRRRVGEVQAIYVSPERWGHGVGRRLMAAGVAHLAGIGCSEATLWVLAENRRARSFYEAGGWRPDGTTKIDDRRGFPLAEVRYRRTTAAGS